MGVERSDYIVIGVNKEKINMFFKKKELRPVVHIERFEGTNWNFYRDTIQDCKDLYQRLQQQFLNSAEYLFIDEDVIIPKKDIDYISINYIKE